MKVAVSKSKNIRKTRPKTSKTGQNRHSDTLSKTPKKRKQRRPYTKDPDSQYLTPAEIDALFKVIESIRDRAIFRIVYHRGLRASEAGQLQMTDWNDRDGLLHVRRGKNSLSRDYRLLPHEVNALRAWVRKRGKQAGPIFVSQKGERAGKLGIHRNQLDRLFRKYCALANIRPEKAHLHVLKHSCGTHLSENGNDAATIQDWLGHRAASSTAIYTHYTQRRRDEAYERNRHWK